MHLSRATYKDAHYINKWKLIHIYQHPLLAPIKADPHVYPFSTVTIDFITDLPEPNRYNTLYVIINHNLIKAIVLIPCTKTINTIRTVKLHYNNIYWRFRLPNKIILDREL